MKKKTPPKQYKKRACEKKKKQNNRILKGYLLTPLAQAQQVQFKIVEVIDLRMRNKPITATNEVTYLRYEGILFPLKH
jgi:hypothetical protein